MVVNLRGQLHEEVHVELGVVVVVEDRVRVEVRGREEQVRVVVVDDPVLLLEGNDGLVRGDRARLCEEELPNRVRCRVLRLLCPSDAHLLTSRL